MGESRDADDATSRYLVHDAFAAGGVGAIHSALDRALHREVAYKVLLPDRASDDGYRIRFVREARLSAQLQHPNILPVYDLGLTPAGELFFAMKRVHGRSLDSLLKGLRLGDDELEPRFPLPRLLAMFGQICQAVHYAHTRGVLHRDLKPGNIMVGSLGEVLLMDWGLAKRIPPLPTAGRQLFGSETLEPAVGLGEGPHDNLEAISDSETGRLVALFGDGSIARSTVNLDPVDDEPTFARLDILEDSWSTTSNDPFSSGDLLGETGDDAAIYETAIGRVLGTPAHMAPEQARGADLDVRTDVYALGTILYEILALRPAFAGRDARRVMLAVTRGRFRKPSEVAPADRPVAPPLEEICLTAMARLPEDRHPTAWDLFLAVELFLQGTEDERRKRKAAELALNEALVHEGRWKTLQERASQAHREATAAMASLKAGDSIEKKRNAWAAEDTASRLELESEREHAAMEGLLREALRKRPDHTEARRTLARHLWRKLQEVERAGRRLEAVRYEEELRAIDDPQWAPLLSAPALLQVDTDPPRAEVKISSMDERDRRLTPGDAVARGMSPTDEVPLPPGRYLVRARLPGRLTVVQPVKLGRGERLSLRLRLLGQSSLPAGFATVPGGSATIGGDRRALRGLRSLRVQLPDFAMMTHPVTMAEYLHFLEALSPEEAWARAPRDEPHGGQYLEKADDGTLRLPERDPAGHEWDPQLPVMAVSFHDAVAYAEWRTACDGVRYRLPTDAEWEYAARSPDGRLFPWGDRWVPGYALVLGTLGTAPQPQAVGWSETDVNSYGLHDMSGGSRDWCDGWKSVKREMRLLRGGAWWDRHDQARLSVRSGWPAANVYGDTGIRLVCSLPAESSGPALLQSPDDPRFGGVRDVHLPPM
ncbi:MAG: SUMF1/EgtB/PvdO family nonheme iron enzyme [Deltaproteobacteria bacterium]|nr:SUMF1/EgtB/PvdO family nonheme iron enzyme [Deltaproteobacteria bacterium]